MSHLLNFNNWLRVNEDATTTNTSKNQIAAPNYWFDKMTVGGNKFDFVNIEKNTDVKYGNSLYGVKDRFSGQTGVQNGRESTVLQITVPSEIKGYENIKKYLETGEYAGRQKYDGYDPTVVGSTVFICSKYGSQTGPCSPKEFITQYNDIRQFPSFKQWTDRNGKVKSYGVNVEGVTTVWELIVKMIAQKRPA